MGEREGARPENPATCPSGRCREGAVLIGIVGEDGRLGYVTPALPVDADFVSRAKAGRTPESRFRFGEPCAEHRCAQWAGDRCGLIEELLDSPRAAATDEQAATSLPKCGIRSSCRWFRERGADACGICPLVVHTPRRPARGAT
jgi:hypothetical protein